MNKVLKTSALLSATLIIGSSVSTLATVSAASYQTINWTESADLGTMDSSAVTDVVSFDALQATGEGLYRNDKQQKPALALAKSVDKSDDGLKYTFHLRSGLKWSNGDALTAQDFVYGWQRTNNPKTASQYAYLFSGIKNADDIQNGKNTDLNSLGVKAIDDTTLEVTLDKPMPQLAAVLTMAPFYPQNEKFVEKAGKKYGTAAKYTLASGPFILKDWTGSNNKYSFVKNTKYYDAKVVKSPKIVVQTIKDQNTGYNLYKSGKIDFTNLSADQVNASKKKKDYRVIPQATTFYLEFNQQKVEFANVKIRQAISYAIDRQQMAKKILTGTATPATSFTSANLAKDPNTGEDFAKSASVKGAITYDAKKAGQLYQEGLKEIGKDKIDFSILTDDTDGAKKTAQFLQSQVEKNLKGSKVSVKTVPFKQRLNLSSTKKFDVVISAWGADYADPISFLDLYTAGTSFNNGSWKNDAYDTAVAKAQGADILNPSARYADLKEAEQVIEKEAGVAPLYYRSYATLFRSSVKGVITSSIGSPYDWKYAYKK
ncbi:peptide ABC transporter substrate-binding protein [Weissella diestrammenae]|uniref:Peptide ABC transporter substrate-binding protein n=1 Tax=Weissella diestrammenae TaxID=1162633 RepID=A0A7G9T6G9_9LACO|nr:peptide ABC transporter substrate-binding protein [Weissella diestrammenae]MCM0583252.1 peptide ABC transporter substrate-binding protein [Weissella diestrammenae]QNN75694.1 peptide ABC transporter substrate-binding protein [Weissella diestrammenae]